MQDDYFKSYEDLEVHRLMLEDVPRTNSYREAILNSGLFKDKIVMDVGAGSGILSLFCGKAGAKKVFAVEASSLYRYLPSVFAANSFAPDTIEVIHGKVEDITIDVTVDIIVSEWMGCYLLHESMLDSVLFARDKFLKKEGGLMFPNKATLYAAPCQVPEVWERRRKYWQEPKYEFDFSPLLEMAHTNQQPEVALIPCEGLLSDPQQLWELNLQTIERSNLESFFDRRFFSIERNGDFHGVGFWFTCSFPVADDDTEEPLALSTAPWDEETHWKQTIVLLPSTGTTCTSLEEGDILGWEIRFSKGDSVRSYSISISILDDDEPHPIPCHCGSAKCEIINAFLTNKKCEATEEGGERGDSGPQT